MDQVTQQNAPMAEQSTAASHSLSEEAERLSTLIDEFRVARGEGAEPARRGAAQAASHTVAAARKSA